MPRAWASPNRTAAATHTAQRWISSIRRETATATPLSVSPPATYGVGPALAKARAPFIGAAAREEVRIRVRRSPAVVAEPTASTRSRGQAQPVSAISSGRALGLPAGPARQRHAARTGQGAQGAQEGSQQDQCGRGEGQRTGEGRELGQPVADFVGDRAGAAGDAACAGDAAIEVGGAEPDRQRCADDDAGRESVGDQGEGGAGRSTSTDADDRDDVWRDLVGHEVAAEAAEPAGVPGLECVETVHGSTLTARSRARTRRTARSG